MNWKRVLTGTLAAAVVLWLFDLGNLILQQRIMVPEPNLLWSEILPISGSNVFPNLIAGGLLAWLYALVRPRLGPGPKTALLMGTVGFLFANPNFFSYAMWATSISATFTQLVLLWMKFAAATYLAGWQYIEKAP